MKTLWWLTTALALSLGANSFASGFEKNIMFGGKTSGVAGIGSPYVQGSEALYFNPAGLAVDKGVQDISLNLSPTFPKFKAPVGNDDVQETAQNKMLLPVSLMYGRKINDSLGVGIGYYVSGGDYADFTDQSIGTLKGTAESKTDLAISEFAVGAGYKIMDKLKVGLAYRVVMAKANLSTVDQYYGVPSLGHIYANTVLSDLSATSYTGFKLGAQYKLCEKTDLGLTYRSNVPLKAKGTVGGHVGTAAGTVDIDSANVNALTTFPDSYTLGVRHQLTDTWNLFGELVYTSYSRNKNVQLQGNVNLPSPYNGLDKTDPAIQLGWKDQQSLKLAGEYTGYGMPIRFGYIWSSRVTDPQFARPSLTPPGPAHTFTLGTGMNFAEAWSVNGGLEYTMCSGNGNSPATTGKYEVTEYALHLGAGWTF